MRPIEFEILLTLATGERHGYAIIKDIEARGDGGFEIATGTLYRALQRLVEGDLVRAVEPGRVLPNDDDRRRFYAITPAGRRAAAAEASRMAALVDAARAARLIPRGA
jgi:DNA-binding PadR family transcriptional regulator